MVADGQIHEQSASKRNLDRRLEHTGEEQRWVSDEVRHEKDNQEAGRQCTIEQSFQPQGDTRIKGEIHWNKDHGVRNDDRVEETQGGIKKGSVEGGRSWNKLRGA